MSSPRQRGIVDALYAVDVYARYIQRANVPDAQQYVDDAHAIYLSLRDQVEIPGDIPYVSGGIGLPYFLTAPLIWWRIDALASREAKVLGWNPIDTDDASIQPLGVGSVGTDEQNAVLGGDIGANVQAIASDLKTSYDELATASKPWITRGIVIALLVVGVIVYWKVIR